MRFALLFLSLLSFSAFAQVYKWVDENGNTHFGTQPPPGEQQQVEIRESSPGAMGSERRYSGSESEIIRRSRALEMQNREKEYENARQRYRSAVSEVGGNQSDRPDYICTGAKDRLRSAEERWQNQKRQGYTQSEKQYHEQRIKDLERHRDNICR